MVGWLIKNENVCTGDHHLGKKTADFLTTGKNAYTFDAVFTGEEHTSEESTNISSILDLRVLCQPVCNGKVIIELCSVVLREICLGSGNTPFIISFIRFHFTDQDLEQSSDCLFVSTDESYFVIMTECERNVIQNFHTVDGLGKVLHHKDFVTDLAVWTEVDVWVFTAGRTHIVKLDLFQGTFTGSRLFGLGSVGTESGNKLLKFFDLFFFLLVGFLHLFDEELAGLKPEVVVSGIELNLAVVDVCCMSTYFI